MGLRHQGPGKLAFPWSLIGGGLFFVGVHGIFGLPAIAQTELIIETYPADPVPVDKASRPSNPFHELLRQGKALAKQGNYDQAIAIYQQAAQLEQNNAELHGSLGYLYARQGQYSDASQQFLQALQLDPNNPDYYDGLGFSYANLGQLSEAASAYGAAINLDPRSVKYQLALGVVLLRQGDYERVRQTYDRIVRLDPQNEEARVMMGSALLQSGQIDQVIAFNQGALRYFPNRSELYLQLGKAYLQQGNLAAARQVLEPRLNGDWRSVSLQLTWASLMEAEQNYPAALDAYKRALRSDPQAIAAKIGSGRMYLTLNQPKEAVWIFRDLTSTDPTNGDFYYLLGEAYQADQKSDLAKQAFEQAQTLYKAQNNGSGQARVQQRLAEL